MSELNQKEITRMEWDDFEGYLLRQTRGGKRSQASDQALRDYFGASEFLELQRLAQQAVTTRSRATPLGNIVLLPGIMGSNLSCLEKGDDDLVWVNLFRLASGRIDSLRLTNDGERDAQPGVSVRSTVIDKRTYARAVLHLRARWNVEPFPYDWRKDIDRSSEALAAFIKEKFKGHAHLVAHSMGGLVARNFIRLNKALWEKMRSSGTKGGRLVMLGTPNYGSFAIPQVLTGVEKLVMWLSKLDLTHSLAEVLNIINSFIGSYQMLPAPDKIPEEMRAIYRRDVWGEFPVSERHLNRALEFHERMKDTETIDPERMAYIAGCNRRTLSGLEILAPGEFRYRESFAGDGRVTHDLGKIDGVRTYFIEEDHGSLTKNDLVLKAIEEILQRGATSLLPEQPVTPRAVISTNGRWYRLIGDYQAGSMLEEIARNAQKRNLTPDEQRVAEETIIQAALGVERPAREAVEVSEQLKEKKAQASGSHPRLELEVIWGDVTKIKTSVIVVGHYKGVNPVQKSALGKLNAELDNWISEAIKRGMVGGDLGQLFFIPINHRKIAAKSVLLAGMGLEGRFSQEDLRFLMLNVTYGISRLKAESYGTTLIGSGVGNLSEDHALRGWLCGICEALNRLPKHERPKRVLLIEKNKDRFEQILKKLNDIKNEDFAAHINLTVKSSKHPSGASKDGVQVREELLPPFGPRITIERDGDFFRFSALTQNAVIPVREVEIQSFFPDGASERLMISEGKNEQERLGRMLMTSLIPEDFVDLFDTKNPLTFILDRSTAAIPWEMGCISTTSGPLFLGPDLSLTRQFRTRLSPAPGISPQLNESLRVLVIADPAPEPELKLPGARLEGRAVVRVLNQIKNEFGLTIEVIDRIGDAECEPIDILSLIFEGGFDVIHYAGHGIFDEKNPERGGWVFGENRILTSREIFRARRVPRIIFANACFSAVVNKSKPLTPAEMNRQLAGIAEAFFERGVQNYIGSGWPVQDDLAVKFATTFYEFALLGKPLDTLRKKEKPVATTRAVKKTTPTANEEAYLISPDTLGEALAKARKAIVHRGATWGAYHFYGQATDRIMPKKQSVPASTPAPAKPKATKKR